MPRKNTWDGDGKLAALQRGLVTRATEFAAVYDDKTQNGEPGGSPLASSVGRRGAEGVAAVRTAKAVCKR
jgi:hypothetical protein